MGKTKNERPVGQVVQLLWDQMEWPILEKCVEDRLIQVA